MGLRVSRFDYLGYACYKAYQGSIATSVTGVRLADHRPQGEFLGGCSAPRSRRPVLQPIELTKYVARRSTR